MQQVHRGLGLSGVMVRGLLLRARCPASSAMCWNISITEEFMRFTASCEKLKPMWTCFSTLGEIGGEALNVLRGAATVMATAAAATAALWCLLCLPWLRFEGLGFSELSSFIAQVFVRQLRQWLIHFRLTFHTAQREIQGGF